MTLPASDPNTRPASLPDSQTAPAGSSDATLVGAPAASSTAAESTVTGSAAADPATVTQVVPGGPPPTPPAGPPPSGPTPGHDYSLPILIGVFVLALVGIGLLGLGVYAVMKLNAAPAVAVSSITATAIPLPSQLAVSVPSTTPLPAATSTATAAPTVTAATATVASTAALSPTAATAPTTATVTITATAAGNLLTINQGANVRTGPGVQYPVIGSIKAGDSAPALGRNAFGNWFLVGYAGGFGGQGWVAAQVATYSGNANQLPVVAAPPPPAPTATPVPAGNPNGALVTGAHGVSGMLNLCSGNVVFGVGQRVCFVEWIKNNTSQPVGYGLLGVTAVRQGGGVQFQTSWSGEQAAHGLLAIDPGCIGPTDRCKGQWEDGMRLNIPGSYQLTLNVCFSGYPLCRGTSGDWEVLSGPIQITVQ